MFDLYTTEQLALQTVSERLKAAEDRRRDLQVLRRVRAQKTLQRAVVKGLDAGMDLHDVKIALAPILHRCRGQ